MSKVSRRTMARYAVDQLLAGKSAEVIARQLASLLIEAGRSNEAEFLIDDILAGLETRRELAVADVTSATSFGPFLREALIKQLQQATAAKQVMLDEHVDKSVIGGARVETTSRVWDYTVARRLAALREVF